jgi:hypothetical protein
VFIQLRFWTARDFATIGADFAAAGLASEANKLTFTEESRAWT